MKLRDEELEDEEFQEKEKPIEVRVTPYKVINKKTFTLIVRIRMRRRRKERRSLGLQKQVLVLLLRMFEERGFNPIVNFDTQILYHKGVRIRK